MGITLGEDYLIAAEDNLKKGVAASKRDARHLFVISGVILTAWISVAYYYGLPDGVMICGTVAIATMCLIWVLNYRTAALEADIIYMSGAIEWFGQKELDHREAAK